jgi:hypothetical protein
MAELIREGRTRIWLSFDLGVNGNYEGLYAWLDDHGAKECGDSVATFLSNSSREEIAEELRGIVGTRARLYIVETHRGGKFFIGKRKSAPWSGYGSSGGESEDEL